MKRPVVSARVDEEVEEELDDLAERTDLTRTDALRRVVRAGLELVEERQSDITQRRYSVVLEPEMAEQVETVAENAGYGTEEFIRLLVEAKVADADG